MKGALIRVGVDSTYGSWNAPVCPDTKRFVYVPIPEKLGTEFQPGLRRPYSEVLPAINKFGQDFMCGPVDRHFCLPSNLLQHSMHLDPDFETLTYGDQGARRGFRIREMTSGDIIAFYGGFRPIKTCAHRLLYALLGIYIVDLVVRADDVSEDKWHENAHTRKLKRGTPDIVVRAKPGFSGRMEKCIAIGEWRSRAYRVRQDLLERWGGLSVNDGYIQRSAVPPMFLDAKRFYRWFLKQNVNLVARNN